MHLLLQTEHGIGQVGDHDLAHVMEHIVDTDGAPVEWETVERLIESGGGALFLTWGTTISVDSIARHEVAARFGFVERPRE